MPEEITEIEVTADEDVRDIITRANIAKSKSDATRLLQQGAVSIDGVKITSGKQLIRMVILLKWANTTLLKWFCGINNTM